MALAVHQLQKVDQAVRVGDAELGIAVGADDHNMFHNIYMYQVWNILKQPLERKESGKLLFTMRPRLDAMCTQKHYTEAHG